jgi:nitrogen fixation-related uncharacterized protein
MDNNTSEYVQESKKGGKGCRILFGCFSVFIVIVALISAFFFIGMKSGMFDSLFESFKESVKSNIPDSVYMKPNAASLEGAQQEEGDFAQNPAEKPAVPVMPVSLQEKKSQLEAWHYVYMKRAEGYAPDLPKDISEKKFESDSDAVAFLSEEIRNGKYKNNEIEAIKNYLDMYRTKVQLANINLEIEKSKSENNPAKAAL